MRLYKTTITIWSAEDISGLDWDGVSGLFEEGTAATAQWECVPVEDPAGSCPEWVREYIAWNTAVSADD